MPDPAHIEKHAIHFAIAARIFENEYFVYSSQRYSESRYVAVGEARSNVIAVIYTVRYEKIRIISARRARKKEEAAYRDLHAGNAS